MKELRRKRVRLMTSLISGALIFMLIASLAAVPTRVLAEEVLFPQENREQTTDVITEEENPEVLEATSRLFEEDDTETAAAEPAEQVQEPVQEDAASLEAENVQGSAFEETFTEALSDAAQEGETDGADYRAESSQAADAFLQSVPLEADPLESVISLQEELSLQEASGKTSLKTGYVNVGGLNVRKGAGTSYAAIGSLSYTTVILLGSAKDKKKTTWYKINYGSRTGYICGDYVSNVKTVKVDTSRLSAFPQEYRAPLAAILAVYPKFTFVPEEIDYTLDEVAGWHTGKKVEADGAGWWKTSSSATVRAYMDPMMYFTTDKIFAFAEQYYNSTQTKAGLKKMLTSLNCFLNTDKYIDALLKAGKKYDVNPYVLAATITIEKGANADKNGNRDVTGRPVFKGTVSKNGVTVRSGAGSGYASRGTVDKGTIYLVGASKSQASYQTVSGKKWYQVIYNGYPGWIIETYLKNIAYYDTYYNLFSINQTDDNVVVGGISYAMKEGWNTPYLSLIGGARFYRNGYINNGQDTYYYKDFNIANDQSNWWHEYAGAINSPAASAVLLSYAYANDTDAKLTFRIPVYKVSGLSAPAGVTATEADHQITVKWKKVQNATGYRVYRKKAGGTYSLLKKVTGTSCQDTAYDVSTAYVYNVRAVDNRNHLSSYGAGASLTTMLPAAKLGSIANRANGTRLTWKAVSGATRYRVYKKISGKWTALAYTRNTYYLDTAVKNGQSNRYRVVACQGSLKGYYDKTGLTYTYWKPPAGVKAVEKSNGVKVTWTKQKKAKQYRIYRKTKGGSWSLLAKTTKTGYTDKTTTGGKTYYYKVRSVGKEGSVSWHKGTPSVTVKLAAPQVKSVVSARSGVKINWKKVKGATHYRVYRKTASGWKKLGYTTKTSFVDKSVANGKTYTYTVAAFQAENAGKYKKDGWKIKYKKPAH